MERIENVPSESQLCYAIGRSASTFHVMTWNRGCIQWMIPISKAGLL
jgi:hypothetical protein